MSLYRIILVDDEEEVRKGIIRKIDWNRLGFEVVGDAENGAEALEKIEQLEPEVVRSCPARSAGAVPGSWWQEAPGFQYG